MPFCRLLAAAAAAPHYAITTRAAMHAVCVCVENVAMMDIYAAKVESHPTDKLYFGLTAEMVLLLEQKTCTDGPQSSTKLLEK